MKNYEELALLRAERIGVYEYKVKKNIMSYYSFFGGEGFYKVEHNLDTHMEIRTHLKYKKTPKHLIGKYNYYTG